MALRTRYVIVLVGALLLAGCTGGLPGTPADPTASPSDTAAPTESAGDPSDPTTEAAMTDDGTGTVDFYISDEANAIDDFAHLNVTVTTVGFQRGGEAGSWIEYDVDNETLDLTELQGPRSAYVDSYDLPHGEYTTVFVYVDAIDATLANGEEVRVKLPSEKLHLNSNFAIENGSEVEFVFDITVKRAGNSGKYLLKPVITESGTDVPIEPTEKNPDAREDDAEKDDDSEDARPPLEMTVEGNLTAGETVTLHVTRNDTGVENASVTVNDELVGTTDADGELQVTIPEADELTVIAGVDGRDVEREFELDADE